MCCENIYCDQEAESTYCYYTPDWLWQNFHLQLSAGRGHALIGPLRRAKLALTNQTGPLEFDKYMVHPITFPLPELSTDRPGGHMRPVNFLIRPEVLD